MNNEIWILDEIRLARKKGIPVRIDETCYNEDFPSELLALKEEETYMADYQGNEEGKIVEIIFNKIKKDNK